MTNCRADYSYHLEWIVPFEGSEEGIGITSAVRWRQELLKKTGEVREIFEWPGSDDNEGTVEDELFEDSSDESDSSDADNNLQAQVFDNNTEEENEINLSDDYEIDIQVDDFILPQEDSLAPQNDEREVAAPEPMVEDEREVAAPEPIVEDDVEITNSSEGEL